MDMMYMPDALHAAISLMEADPARLIHHNGFNVASRTLRRWQETHQRRRESRQFRQRMGATLSAFGQWQHRLQRDGVGERRKVHAQ